MYSFDKIVDRNHTSNVKYDMRNSYFGKPDLLPMWVADMDFETPYFIREAVIERAKHPIYGYSFRTDDYFQSIIKWIKKRHNWNINKEWILSSPGIVPALNFAVHAFTHRGDGIIVQPPVYFPFFNAVNNNGRKVIYNQLVYDGQTYQFDFDDLSKKARKAKMLFLCSPHNPVSRCWTKDELLQLADICVKNNLIIVSDEIHNDLVLPDFKHYPTATLSEEIADITLTFVAPSKTFNLAGLATSSVIISNENLRKKFNDKLEEYHISGINLFGMIASEAAYTYGEKWLDEMLYYLKGNFELLENTLNNEFETLSLVKPEATYLAWIDFRKTGLKDEDIKNRLINKAELGLSHGPVFGHGGEGFQRMNLAAPRLFIHEALGRLRDYFD
jgi:cystathionine beta-lyase